MDRPQPEGACLAMKAQSRGELVWSVRRAVPCPGQDMAADFLQHHAVVVFVVRKGTVLAYLDASFRVEEVSSTFVAQNIQGAIAEQAVEVFFCHSSVAGKIFAILVCEKGVLFSCVFPVGHVSSGWPHPVSLCCNVRKCGYGMFRFSWHVAASDRLRRRGSTRRCRHTRYRCSLLCT